MKLLLYAYNIKILTIENIDMTMPYSNFYADYWHKVRDAMSDFCKNNKYVRVEFTIKFIENKKSVCALKEHIWANNIVLPDTFGKAHKLILANKLKSLAKLGT